MEKIKDFKENFSKYIKKSNKILIVPHIQPDFDALGSSVGIVNICKKFDKESYILINDDRRKLAGSVNIMIDKIAEKYKIIDLEKYVKYKDDIDTLITTDVNKSELIAIKDYLQNFKSKIVIDHHDTGITTIESNYNYINTDVSSTCEIIAKLLCLLNIKYDKECATFLYSGIYLDTNNLTKNLTSNTFNIISKLIKNGADIEYVNDLFVEIFEKDRERHRLIDNTKFYNIEDDNELQSLNYAITCGKENIYPKEELAKAADYVMKYKVDASFVIGLLDENLVGISGRSNGKIDIGKILSNICGGGNKKSGASIIKDSSILDTSKKLQLILKNNY